MPFTVFTAVVLAAFLHASWNVLVKINLDRFLALFLIHVLMGFVGLAMLAWTGLPIRAAWPFAIVSGLLHTSYNLLLARSYKYGEMSVVYPIARGAAPMVALIFSLVFAGDIISAGELGALGVLIGGLWLIAMSKSAALGTDGRTIGFALATAFFIGCYTVVDGMGARASGDAMAYSGLIFGFDGLFLLIAGLFLRGTAIVRQVSPFLWRGIVGAFCSSLAYGLVIWAMTRAPIGMVAALRETSILFVLGMSVLFLHERLTAMRYAGAALIVAGAAALRFM